MASSEPLARPGFVKPKSAEWQILRRSVPIVLGLVGLAGMVALVLRAGVSDILGQLSSVGWLLVPLALLHVVPITLDAAAWRLLTPPPRLRLLAFVAARWMREGVNALLPAAQIGGEIVAVRMLARFGASPAKASTAVSIDLATEFFSMVIAGTVGAAVLFQLSPPEAKHQAALVGWAMVPAGVLAVAFLLVQRTTLLGRLADWAGMRWPRFAAPLAEAQNALTAAWSRPRQLVLAVGLHGIAWTAGAIETWAMLHALGHPLRPEQAFALETTTEVLRSFGFAIPGLLGVQEGSLILVGSLVGLPPAGAIALSLFRRARDIGLGLPALALWQFIEHTGRRRGAETLATTPLQSDMAPANSNGAQP